jgi:hypothetical protein
MSEIDPRDFGRLESEVATLTELVRAQTLAMAQMATRMDTMNATLTEARGGWKMLLLLGGAGAAARSSLGC